MTQPTLSMEIISEVLGIRPNVKIISETPWTYKFALKEDGKVKAWVFVEFSKYQQGGRHEQADWFFSHENNPDSYHSFAVPDLPPQRIKALKARGLDSTAEKIEQAVEIVKKNYLFVLNTVMYIIYSRVKELDLDSISLSGANLQLTRLYKRIVSKFLHNFEQEGYVVTRGLNRDDQVITLTKMKPHR